jgi:hypothetical protein
LGLSKGAEHLGASFSLALSLSKGGGTSEQASSFDRLRMRLRQAQDEASIDSNRLRDGLVGC